MAVGSNGYRAAKTWSSFTLMVVSSDLVRHTPRHTVTELYRQTCSPPGHRRVDAPIRLWSDDGLTGMYGPPLRRKRNVRMSQVGLRKCIRPLLERITPGQDGMRCALFPI